MPSNGRSRPVKAAPDVVRPESSTRKIELAWAAGLDGMRRLTAECDDERTEMVFMGPALFDESRMEEVLAGKFGESVILDHQSRCDACQRWAQKQVKS